jgi:flagellar hook-associated protein 2
MRIGGLASGMDIDQIVGDLMKAERMPLDKLKQQKQILEWQRDDYRSMNTLLFNFRSELLNMKLTTQYRARSVTSTNSDLISATASSAASQASYTINSVSKLASAATKVSGDISATDKIDPTQSLHSQQAKLTDIGTFTWSKGSVESQNLIGDGTTNLFSITKHANEKVDISMAERMSVKVNGKSYKVVAGDTSTTPSVDQVFIDINGNLKFNSIIPKDASIKFDYILEEKVETKTLPAGTKDWQLGTTLLTDLKVTMNGVTYNAGEKDPASGKSALTDGVTVIGNVDLATGKVEFVPELPSATDVTFSYKHEYSTFDLTTQTSKGTVKENFIVSASDSLNQVISKVNSSNAGVTMYYDSYADQISLTRTETGDFLADGTLSDELTKINQIEAGGLFATNILKLTAGNTNGTNAEFNINGLETKRNTNTFELNGVTFTLKNKFTTADTPISLSINNDSNKVFENIKAFVDKYNDLIDKIQKKTSEEVYRSYKPLTDEQRESLSEKQQEQWEEKAQSGLLRRDSILSGVLGDMRSNFYAPVKNSDVDPLMNQLASIGIKTTANYLQGGKLEINEAELKKVIENDPESVENLFRGTGSSFDEQGIIHRLYDTVNGAIDKLKERAGNTFTTTKQFVLGRQLDNVNSRINRFEDRLFQVENRYWRQFTAMEKAIQRANSQSSYLMQQFNSGY